MAMLAVQSSIASPKRLAAPRVMFILRGESYVGYPCFGADVQHLDDVFVGAGFVAANHHRLFGIQLNHALQ
jgi:hypothetical protein